jgi:DNA-binding transcriptional LysR family regulator
MTSGGFWCERTSLDDFKNVAEIGSVPRAARTLNLFQSAVSQQIQLLERSYATVFFVRTSQKVRLTEMGEVLYRHVTAILRRIPESQDAILASDPKPSEGLEHWRQLDGC